MFGITGDNAGLVAMKITGGKGSIPHTQKQDIMDQTQYNGINAYLKKEYPGQNVRLSDFEKIDKRCLVKRPVWVDVGTCNTVFVMIVDFPMKWCEKLQPLW